MRTLNTIAILILSLILMISIAEQLLDRQLPCAFCTLQRNGMVLTAIALAMNLLFGIRVRYYALALLSSILGAAIALRQIALHACPSFPIFGNPLFGLSLYTWSFLIFSSSILGVSLLLFFYQPEESKPCNWFDKATLLLLTLITITLPIITFQQCGFGDCKGMANAAKYTRPRIVAR